MQNRRIRTAAQLAGTLGLVSARQQHLEKTTAETLPRRTWLLILPIFAAGFIATAVGVTVAQSDPITFAGLLLTAFGTVGMWAVGQDEWWKAGALGMGLFVAGSVLAGIALTWKPSNGALCAGMMMTGLGIAQMWMSDKEGILSRIVSGVFSTGIVLEAVGLSVAASNVVVLMGTLFIGAGVFGMWTYETDESKVWYAAFAKLSTEKAAEESKEG